METYDVKVFPSAQIDILEISADPCVISSGKLTPFYESLMDAADILRIAPEQFPPAKDILFRLRGYRVVPLDDYIGFYAIRGKTVELRRIFFSRALRENLY